jgi:carbonic anhydrase/acetyltransferase-like protein (isoleucine patch superfamily)
MTMHHRDNAYIADTARVIGDVRLGESVNIWYGAAIRGDVAPVVIGDRSNVQDNAVIHCDHRYANVIGSDVIIGHGAIVHGEFIGDNTLIGMGAIVLGRTRIGSGCVIGAGALVPPGLEVPDGSVVMGVPGKVVRPTNDADKAYLAKLPLHYVRLAQRHVEHPDDPVVFEMDEVENRSLLGR